MNDKRIELIFQEPIIQGKKTMSLFRDNFKLENKSSDHYMKLQQGDNKIRILSAFIDGWEEWSPERKPIRFKDKPENLREGMKQFVAAIVWNYNEKRIQILQLTQVGIIRAIQNLSDDADWGPVFFYDIKITRSGKEKLTKYDVNPLPTKALDPEIERAFREKPCCLEAIYVNSDPFAEGLEPTPGVFRKDDLASDPFNSTISPAQERELLELIYDDEEFKKELQARLKKAFGSEDFSDIPHSQFGRIKDVILKHNQSKLDGEMKEAG